MPTIRDTTPPTAPVTTPAPPPAGAPTAGFAVMYHVSGSGNRDSIRATGLRADPGQPSDWAPYVWLFSDRDEATGFLAASWGGSRGRNDLWAVDTRALAIQPDPDPAWGGRVRSWVHEGPIPAARLSLLPR